MPPAGDLAHNPGMCPNWESNQGPFGSQAGTQSTEPHLPRLEFFIYVHERYGSVGVFSPLLLVSGNAVLVE